MNSFMQSSNAVSLDFDTSSTFNVILYDLTIKKDFRFLSSHKEIDAFCIFIVKN